jgi:hypothetical protein
MDMNEDNWLEAAYEDRTHIEDPDFDPDMSEEPDMDERDVDDSMDGDHESALASAGFGTDEDYGYFGGDE